MTKDDIGTIAELWDETKGEMWTKIQKRFKKKLNIIKDKKDKKIRDNRWNVPEDENLPKNNNKYM